ncbi:MAG TPA: CBS domain-containing protein [bacterium]|nr:CBS domain-containing protein [bacterium]
MEKANGIQDKKRELLEFIREGQPHLLRDALSLLHPAKLCAVVRLLTDRETVEFLEALDNEQIIELFKFLEGDRKQRLRILKTLPPKRVDFAIEDMSSEAANAMFEGISKQRQSEIIGTLSEESRRKIEAGVKTGGGRGLKKLITNDFMSITEGLSIAETLKIMRELKHSSDRPNQIYVTDSNGRLTGSVDLHQLLHAGDPAGEIGNFAKECQLRFDENEEPVVAARTLVHYGLESAPVTDSENRLIGAITSRGAYKLLDSEKEERMDISAGMPKLPKWGDEISAGIFIVKTSWMIVIMAASLFTAAVVAIVLSALDMKNTAPLICAAIIAIPVSRLYAKHSLILLQKRHLAKFTGADVKRRQFQIGMAAAVLFAVATGIAFMLLDPDPSAFLFGSLTVIVAALWGTGNGFLLHSTTKSNERARISALNPMFLAISDVFAILTIILIFRFLLT